MPGPVLTDPADVDGPVDVVLLAVKDTQNRERRGRGWRRLCDERTVVCALQNGVEQVERVGPLCPASEVVPAVVWFSAEPQPERLGSAAHRCPAGAARVSGAARRSPDLFDGTEVTVELDPDFVTAAWHKLLVNAVAGSHGADRTPLGHVPPRRCRRVGAPLSRRMPRGGASRGRQPRRRRHRRDRRHVRQGARGHDDVDADRPRSAPAAGVGHPQRRHLTQGRRGTAWPRRSATCLVPLLAAASDGPG